MPNWADEQWGETIYQYYGMTPYWKNKGGVSIFDSLALPLWEIPN